MDVNDKLLNNSVECEKYRIRNENKLTDISNKISKINDNIEVIKDNQTKIIYDISDIIDKIDRLEELNKIRRENINVIKKRLELLECDRCINKGVSFHGIKLSYNNVLILIIFLLLTIITGGDVYSILISIFNL